MGLPWETWLLAAAAVLPGLALAFAFHRAHRRTPPDTGSGEG